MASQEAILDYIARNFVAADFADEQIPDRTVLKIAIPRGTPVSVDLVQTIERAMEREPFMAGTTPPFDITAQLSVQRRSSEEE